MGSILWRRLDSPGHDACRLVSRGGGWLLEGTAAFREEGANACLTYKLECDAAWRTQSGAVHGWLGQRAVDARIERSSGNAWTLNGRIVPGLDGCVDLDLGFTPATNLSQIRRAALRVGQAADVPVAWLALPFDTLEVLHQRYERRTDEEYRYESPRFGYSALLRVDPRGFVTQYPDLWEAEP